MTMVWTEEHVTLLREAYERGGIKAAVIALPGRSTASIYQRANILGLKRLRMWSAEEDEKLRLYWGLKSLATIARELKRSQIGVYMRAVKHLGLQAGCPEGWEYLSEAARRTGYAISTLWDIMRAAKMRILESYTYRESGSGRRYYIVEPSDVNHAVALRCASETVFDAAKRRGLTYDILKARLIAAGVKRPEKKNAAWRIASTEIDAVLQRHAEMKAEGETLGEAAKRYRVRRETLVRWLKQHKIVYKKGWVNRLDVDKVIWAERRRPNCRAFKQAS